LFPLLAKAHGDGDGAAVRNIVSHGCRVAMLVVGLLVSVTAALPHGLLRLVFPPQFADVGADSMRLLCVGMGGLALFGVFGSVLNGLGKQWLGLRLTAAGLALVAALNWLLVRDASFGPELLGRTAAATSTAVIVAALASGFAVQRLTGGGLRAVVLLRVGVAMAACVLLGQWSPATSKLLTLVLAGGFAAVYVAVLVLLREVSGDDWRALRSLGRRREPS
jgi:stage V sporulation protein B